MDLLNDLPDKQYGKALEQVIGLKKLVQAKFPQLPENINLMMMEYLLHAMAEYSYLSKSQLERSFEFGDLLSSIFNAQQEK